MEAILKLINEKLSPEITEKQENALDKPSTSKDPLQDVEPYLAEIHKKNHKTSKRRCHLRTKFIIQK